MNWKRNALIIGAIAAWLWKIVEALWKGLSVDDFVIDFTIPLIATVLVLVSFLLPRAARFARITDRQAIDNRDWFGRSVLPANLVLYKMERSAQEVILAAALHA